MFRRRSYCALERSVRGVRKPDPLLALCYAREGICVYESKLGMSRPLFREVYQPLVIYELLAWMIRPPDQVLSDFRSLFQVRRIPFAAF